MDEREWLAERFDEYRPHLKAVAYRMLGSLAEADDAVQDAWLRLSRYGADGVENLGGWLTAIVARVCLNMLRSRNLRREVPLGVHVPDPLISLEVQSDGGRHQTRENPARGPGSRVATRGLGEWTPGGSRTRSRRRERPSAAWLPGDQQLAYRVWPLGAISRGIVHELDVDRLAGCRPAVRGADAWPLLAE
jgi:hypothetical protein